MIFHDLSLDSYFYIYIHGIHTWTPLWYRKTCTTRGFDTSFLETSVVLVEHSKRALFFSGTFRSIPGLGQPYMLLLQPFGEFGVDFCLFASFPGQCHKDTLLIKVACVSH